MIGAALAGLYGVVRVMALPLTRGERTFGWASLAISSLALVAYVLQGAAVLAAPWLPGAQKLASLALVALIALRLMAKAE